MSTYLNLRKTKDGERFFSYERIRDQINRVLSTLDYAKFEYLKPIDMLAVDFHEEAFIGDLREVEWRPFGISHDNLPQFIAKIDNREEGVRVLTYLRGHGEEVLPEGASREEIEEFERYCAYLINQEIKQSKNDVLTEAQKLEIRPNLRNISLEKPIPDHPWFIREHKIIFNHMWKQPYYEYINLYPYQAVCCAAQDLMDVLTFGYKTSPQKVYPEPQNIVRADNLEPFLKLVKKRISLRANRYVLNHFEPVIQTLFALCVKLESVEVSEIYQEAGLNAAYTTIEQYIRDTYHLDLRKSIADAVSEIRQLPPREVPVIEYRIPKSTNLSTDTSSEKQNELDVYKSEKRPALLRKVYEALKKEMGDVFEGKSQWFYVYKLMVEKGIYTNRQYCLFKGDLITAKIPTEELPDTSTFTRKYKQLPEGSKHPWHTKNGGRSDILDEGNRIGNITKTTLGL